MIGLGYFVIINGYALNSVSLNAARDVPGRMVCAAFFGKGEPASAVSNLFFVLRD